MRAAKRFQQERGSNLERDVLIDGIGSSLAQELSLTRTPTSSAPSGTSLSPRTLVELITGERLTGFVLEHSTSFLIPPEALEKLSSGTTKTAEPGLELTTLSLQAWTLRVSRLLSDASIDHLVFKGWPLAAMSATDASLRGAGDVDVLIRPSDLRAADDVLTRSGFWPVYAVGPRTKLGWSFVRFRNRELPYRSSWAEVDIHWRVATEPDMLPPTATLLDRAVSVGKAGQEIRTLHPSDALAAAAFHFYLDYCVSLRRLIDFIRLTTLADDSVLPTLPKPARQLIADLACFCEELFGLSLPPLSGLPVPNGEHVARMGELFALAHSGTPGALRAPDGPGGRFGRNYRHLKRYSARHRLLWRLIARGLVWFPPTEHHPRRIGLLQALLWQLGRLLRGRTSSHI